MCACAICVVDEDGAHAIGTAAAQFAAYRAGTGVDAIAGVEAILSHLIAHQFHVPCAHAPAFLPADLGMLLLFYAFCFIWFGNVSFRFEE